MTSRRRVVITGAGAISPCGKDVAQTWSNVVGGKSGIDTITAFDPEAYASKIAGECTDFDPLAYIEKKRLREGGRFIHFALGATAQAVAAAGFEPTDQQRQRVGTFIGVGFCGIGYLERNHKALLEKGPRRVSAYFVPATISNMAAGQVSIRYGLRGPSYAHSSACSSGAHAIGDAAHLIAVGKIDAAIAGGAESPVTPMGVAGFASMRALSKRNDAPTEASRPFDDDHDGFVIAEGAGVVVLEEREAAIARGATIIAEIVGYGATSDAHHMTQPAPKGEGAQRAMRLALADAELSPGDVGYINAHGTSTPLGDTEELLAIRQVFGAHATDGLAVSSTKSMTGHLLGAAGGLETVLVALALRDSVLPPTMNLNTPVEAAQGMNLVANVAQERPTRVALSNSFGFGGTNVSLVLREHR